MSYHPHYFAAGRYIIKDEDYDHELCSIQFIDDGLSEKRRQKLAGKLMRAILKRLNNEARK